MPANVVLILYTTLYRLGGREMELAAQRMASDKAKEFPDDQVIAKAIESKAEFLAAITEVPGPIREYHFIGHSGLYGPMYGTTSHPDQMSRAEWANLHITFAKDAKAYFHCCRSARWFAPFFARRYQVVTFGNMSYTTFSHQPDIYEEVKPGTDRSDVFVVSAPGLKGMGVAGAIRKRVGKCPTIPMARFEPCPPDADESYDGVAELYDAVFEDFRVRQDEWRWVSKNLPRDSKVLDIGCGNGALLLAIAPLITEGIGVDASQKMIEMATRRSYGERNLRFETISGPVLPLEDASVDVVMSMLSWRYLDWDPMVAEIKRVLRPGGRVLIVDMVVSPFRWKAVGRVMADKLRAIWQGIQHPNFKKALRRLVDDRNWAEMLRHNPMRAQHEYRNYLPSRFPGVIVETLNLSPRSEIIAFRWDDPAAG
jgi:ubiquinone/menaquinone biosynthesis C-methylase UbiE